MTTAVQSMPVAGATRPEPNAPAPRFIRSIDTLTRADVTIAGGKGTVSICGQAPSVHPEYADFLVDAGVDSICVVPDAIERTRINVARAERRISLNAARMATESSKVRIP